MLSLLQKAKLSANIHWTVNRDRLIVFAMMGAISTAIGFMITGDVFAHTRGR